MLGEVAAGKGPGDAAPAHSLCSLGDDGPAGDLSCILGFGSSPALITREEACAAAVTGDYDEQGPRRSAMIELLPETGGI